MFHSYLSGIALQDVYTSAGLISRKAMDDDHKENSRQLINVFISFHLFGLFGALIILLTVLSSRSISRHSTWFSFIFSWILSAVSYTLLFWGGKLTGPEPEYSFCLIQGIMTYAAPPLTAATTLALVIQIWFLVRSVVTSTSPVGSRMSPLFSTILLVVPYILYVSILVGTFIMGIQHPRIVHRVKTGMYCNFSSNMPGRLSTSLVALIMIPAVVLEVLVCYALHLQWELFKCQRDALSMILRVVSFTCFGIMAITLSLIFFFKVHHGAELNVVISLLPVASVLIFGTQADLIRVWMFWKKREESPALPKKDVNSSTALPTNNMDIVSNVHA